MEGIQCASLLSNTEYVDSYSLKEKGQVRTEAKRTTIVPIISSLKNNCDVITYKVFGSVDLRTAMMLSCVKYWRLLFENKYDNAV